MYGFKEIRRVDRGSTGMQYIMNVQSDIPTIAMVHKLMRLGDNVVIEQGLTNIPPKMITVSAHYFIDGNEVAHYVIETNTLVILECPRRWDDKFIHELMFVD